MRILPRYCRASESLPLKRFKAGNRIAPRVLVAIASIEKLCHQYGAIQALSSLQTAQALYCCLFHVTFPSYNLWSYIDEQVHYANSAYEGL